MKNTTVDRSYISPYDKTLLKDDNKYQSILSDEYSIQYSHSPCSDVNLDNQDSNASAENCDNTLKEILNVYVRLRPNSKQEKNTSQGYAESTISMTNNRVISILNSSRETVKSFQFELIFSEEKQQDEVFHTTTAPLIKHSLMGYNGTIFVYGQTGTGKTYTMGLLSKLSHDSTGIIPFTLKYLFHYFEEAAETSNGTYNW